MSGLWCRWEPQGVARISGAGIRGVGAAQRYAHDLRRPAASAGRCQVYALVVRLELSGWRRVRGAGGGAEGSAALDLWRPLVWWATIGTLALGVGQALDQRDSWAGRWTGSRTRWFPAIVDER